MNRSQFTNKYSQLNLSQNELDRKWRLQVEHELAEQRMLEAQAYQIAHATPVVAAGKADDSFNEYVELNYINDYFEL